MATQFIQYPAPSISLSPITIQYDRDTVSTKVSEDTSTPANSRPLPVKVFNTSGVIVNLATEATLAAASAKLPAALGQTTMASSLAVSIASDQSSIPVTGTFFQATQPVSAASLPLPAGASTETTLAALNTKVPANLTVTATRLLTDGSGVTQPVSGTFFQGTQPVSAASLPLPAGAATETTLAAQSAKLPATLGASTSALSLAVVLASDQAALPVNATQTGTWTVQPGNTANTTPWLVNARAQDGAGNVVTSVLTGANRGFQVSQQGRSVVTTIRNDYTSGNVTTGAWVQLVASTGAEVAELEIFDSSGQTLEIGTGAAASEARLILLFPGGNGRVCVHIPAATRVSVRAVSALASVGELNINFYGL